MLKVPGIGCEINVPVVCGIENPLLLPHFLRHYKSLGITDYYFYVHKEFVEQVCYVCNAYDVCGHIKEVNYVPFEEGGEVDIVNDIIKYNVEPRDYVIPCNLDEFHEFPYDLGMVVRDCIIHKLDVVNGIVIDRFAENGRFEILTDVDIEKQFPIGAKFTSKILKGSEKKVMLCKADAIVGSNHDRLKSLNDALKAEGKIHHYKWFGQRIKKVMRRSARTHQKNYSSESLRLIRHLRGLNSVDLTMPIMEAVNFQTLPQNDED